MKQYTPEQLRILDARISRTCHPKQLEFVLDDGRFVSCLVGRGGGKSVGLLMRLLRRMMHQANSNCLFIAATRSSAERLIWTMLKNVVTNLRLGDAVPNESKLTMTLPNGSRLMLFGADDKADVNKLRGITYHEVGVDETGSIKIDLLKELLVEVIGPRMVGAMCLIGTPGKRLEGTFFEVTHPGSPEHRPWSKRNDPDYAGWQKWSSHAWTVHDGASSGIAAMQEFLKIAEINKANNGWSDTNPYWLREYCAVWAQDDTSSVYVFRADVNLWAPTLDARGFAIHPIDKRDLGIGIGIDLGWKDAFALTVFAFSYSDPSRTLYQIYEVNRPRLYAKVIAQILIGDEINHDRYGGIIGHLGWPDVLVGDFAGAGGALLEELKTVYGITVTAADKALRLKENSIELFNGDLHDGRIKVMKGSVLARQLAELQWQVDAYGKRIENKGQPNDQCDSALYARNAIAPLLPPAGSTAPSQERRPIEDPDDVITPPTVEYGDADAMYAAEDL